MNLITRLSLFAVLACSAAVAAPKATPTETQTGKNEEINVEYTVSGIEVSGLADRDVQRQVNEALEQAAWSPVKSFLLSMTPGNGLLEKDGDGLPGGPMLQAMPNSIDVSITAQLINDSILSFEIGVGTYTGGAHGHFGIDGLVFDAKTGALLELEQLVDQAAPADMLEVAREQLRAEYGDSGLETPSELGLVIPTREGFDVVWGLYELGPYALGTPRVSIPYTSMNEQILFDFAVQSEPKPADEPSAPTAGLEDALKEQE